jgi:hypothetical protein
VVAAGLAVAVILGVAAGVAWAARLLHVGSLDALDPGAKVGAPVPGSALDWPELHVRAAVSQDTPDDAGVVLIHAQWPGHPDQTATLLARLDGDEGPALQLLSQWCAQAASVSPSRCGPGWFELRRRRSLERVRGELIAEDYVGARDQRQRPVRRRTGRG